MNEPAPPALHVRGVVLPDEEQRDLYIREGTVTFTPVPGAATIATGWVVPGLVDAHCHVGLGAQGPVAAGEQERQARDDRDAGALALRDCGSPADTRWIDLREDLPVIVRAGRHLARARRYLPGVGEEIEPEQLPAAAVAQARRGDGWVKIVGDWIDRDSGDLASCWPAEALTDAISRVHEMGVRVTTHVFGGDAIDGLLDAGVDCIEHGTGLRAEQLERMAATGVTLVPTLVNIATFPSIAERATRYPTYAAHMRALHARAPGMVRDAWEAGVAIRTGTDAGGGIEHGRIADEVVALHQAGVPPTAALAAASWDARRWLGLDGLRAGASADFVVYASDPRRDLRILGTPTRVVLRGRVVR
ncbi:MAG: amidohydrolase family protein [Actinomycetes bacterium]